MTSSRDALGTLASRGLDVFTVQDLREVLDLTPTQAKNLASRLNKEKVVTRIKRGVYALTPMEDWLRPPSLPIDWFRAAAAVSVPDPYFLAYYSAFEIHHMTQHPLRTVYVASMRQKPDFAVGRVKFRFVTIKASRFFGEEETSLASGRRVWHADLERTILDGVDRPELCGGLTEVARGIARKKAEIDAGRLVKYLMRLDSPVLAKRTGFLMDALQAVDTECLWQVKQLSGHLKHYVPLDKGSDSPVAHRSVDWEVDVNLDLEKMLAATRT